MLVSLSQKKPHTRHYHPLVLKCRSDFGKRQNMLNLIESFLLLLCVLLLRFLAVSWPPINLHFVVLFYFYHVCKILMHKKSKMASLRQLCFAGAAVAGVGDSFVFRGFYWLALDDCDTSVFGCKDSYAQNKEGDHSVDHSSRLKRPLFVSVDLVWRWTHHRCFKVPACVSFESNYPIFSQASMLFFHTSFVLNFPSVYYFILHFAFTLFEIWNWHNIAED
jgi:hypothetical protein